MKYRALANLRRGQTVVCDGARYFVHKGQDATGKIEIRYIGNDGTIDRYKRAVDNFDMLRNYQIE